MVGAAPGATILAELEALFDGGLSLEDMAIAIAANPAFAGDDGLYPDYLPNAIFADQWTSDLLGDSVSEENLAIAIEAVTGLLNSGTGRGALMYAAITAVAAVDPEDADFGGAASLLANKTAVAEYYSITVAQDGADLAALQAALAGVTEDEATVATANTAIDDVIAANADLSDLVVNWEAANDARDDFLDSLEDDDDYAALDPTGTSVITAADVAAIAATSTAAVEAAVIAAGGAAGYAAASDALKSALVSDAYTANTLALVGLNATLATALGATSGTASITGLDGAIANLAASISASDDAIQASALAQNAADAALANYNTLTGAGAALNANGTTDDASIILSGSSLVLGAGITEVTNPGVTALLAASTANEVAQLAEIAAIAAANSALDIVENLDQVAARTAELTAVDALMNFVSPATAGEPTDAEMAAEQAALDAGVAQLQADIEALTFDTDDATTQTAFEAITTAAVTAGFLAAGDKTAIDTAFDTAGDGSQDDQTEVNAAIVDAVAALATNNLAVDFDAAVVLYLAEGTALTGGEDLPTALALAPIALAADVAQAAVDAEVALGTDLTDALADEALHVGYEDSLGDLDDAITDAEDAFGDAGYAAPVELDSAVKAATSADDLFFTGGINSQIISFSGDDTLFIGADLVLNPDTTAGDEGDNSVLEVWITGTTNAILTIETSVFGSEAATPELYTIQLTGVSSADVSFADGFITVS
jgi:hypothetical protein